MFRYFGSSSIHNSIKLRNIGICAHVDGGKTTLTERFLYHAKMIFKLGNVDHGDTTTDYLAEERERGITIQSACISFDWLNHQINLIDTPGHIDFNIEVQRCLPIIDGLVVLLDACKGVEAQTETVWRQADSFNIPRLLVVNKMDKEGADLDLSLQSIKKKNGYKIN